ncbi:type II toxin-antitoxin system VapC family toxin [soil metagenome]
MILPDVNVLVYAFRREAQHHERYAGWLSEVVAGAEELALHELCLTGFLRIVTNPRIMAVPAPPEHAVDFADRLVAARRGRWLAAPSRTWEQLAGLVRTDRGLRGNLLPDAHLAALALTHGARLATADRGFARFPGLTWFDPAAA